MGAPRRQLHFLLLRRLSASPGRHERLLCCPARTRETASSSHTVRPEKGNFAVGICRLCGARLLAKIAAVVSFETARSEISACELYIYFKSHPPNHRKCYIS